MRKISNRVVCVNGKRPNSFRQKVISYADKSKNPGPKDEWKKGLFVSLSSYLQFVFLLSAHDPSLALCLRVNKKRIPCRLGNDDAILNGELVAWETVEIPLTNLWISQKKTFNYGAMSFLHDWLQRNGSLQWLKGALSTGQGLE